MPEARARGYKPGRFSFNVKGGRCEECQGAGVKVVEMQFLADVQVPCDACEGRRFNPETREIRYKGRTIDEVLDWEQLEYRGYWQPVTDSASAQWKTPGSPFRLTGTPAQKASPAPRLGEHNQEIFGRLLGLPNGELAALQHTGVI